MFRSMTIVMLIPSWFNLQVYVDEDASISTIERRASLKEFYGMHTSYFASFSIGYFVPALLFIV
jgi:hypothetical protein